MNSTSGIANVFGILIALVGFAACLIWIERRLLGFWQDRYGPNRVGPFGALQVVADMIKILFKEDWIPPFADARCSCWRPRSSWPRCYVVRRRADRSRHRRGRTSISACCFFWRCRRLPSTAPCSAGWASNNKYSLLGRLRAAAQMLSYEVFMGLSLMGVVMLAGSFDLRDIVEAQHGLWLCIPQFLGFVIFLIAGIAETQRLPFDMPEAESELIAGFHTEYSGMKFGMFFIGEYVGIVLISAMIVTLFFGGWLGPVLPPLLWFLLKTSLSSSVSSSCCGRRCRGCATTS